MPSLKALGEFKSSFAEIGRENEIRMEQNIPEDDLLLPEHEPSSIPVPETTAAPAEVQTESTDDLLDFGDLGDLLGTGDSDFMTDAPDSSDFQDTSDFQEPAAAEDLDDLGSLLDTIPDDPGSAGEANEIEAGDINEAIDISEDDFNVPSELLSGLNDGIDETGESPEEISEELPEEIFETMPEEMSEEITEELPEEIFETIPEEISEELPEELFETMPEEISEELPEALIDDFPEEMADESPVEITDELPQEPAEPMDGFDMGGDYEDAPAEEETVDSLDQMDLGSQIDQDSENLADNFSLGSSDFSSLEQDMDRIDDFALPGIDDVFGPRNTSAESSGVDEILGEPDEIRLKDNEARQLRETLASYPLNLRIACMELIAEEVVAPDQMANLIKLLVRAAPPKETAALAGRILGRTISIPRGFEKMTGEQLETEQASFAYIFVHNFLPVLRTFMAVALVLVSLGYLIWNFIYLPQKAESIYRRGYERIGAGEYGRARDLFREAFGIHQKKEWFYRYAQAYRDERQYIFAEEKYDELLNYTASKNKRRIPEKRAVLEYAYMETNYLGNYSKADSLLRRNILDFSIWDREALLALGDNSLAWGDIEKERYEDAREAYAKLLQRYGRTDPILERMLKYFIRTDNLGEVLTLQNHFMSSERRKIEAETLAELGGFLMDKSTEEVRGIPDVNLENIGGIRDVLLRAIRTDPLLPESYYHLSRYYNYYGNYRDEELTLGRAIQAFDAAKLETPRRLGYRIESLRRYAEMYTLRGEFFRAEEYLVRGAGIYEDGLSRRVISPSPKYGRIYADLGDLEFFAKDGNAAAALDYYRRSEQNGYAPAEIQYRMGAAHYQIRQWSQALERFTAASFPLPFNQRILYALGNTSYLRGNYFAAQGYYDRLLEILESDMTRFSLITPTDDRDQLELTERLMVVQNNLAVTLEALTLQTGNNNYRARALGLYSESERAWDILTRNPETMVRLRPSPEIIAPGINPAYLNVQNSLYPISGYEPLFFMRIDKDLLEPSVWEEIAPSGYSLSEGVSSGR